MQAEAVINCYIGKERIKGMHTTSEGYKEMADHTNLRGARLENLL
jgi:hypothetical protein